MRKAYQTRSSKVLPKTVSGSASEFIPVTYSVPQKIGFTGVGHGISIGYPVLETFESESTSDC
jgi:hypothetical protein